MMIITIFKGKLKNKVVLKLTKRYDTVMNCKIKTKPWIQIDKKT